MCLEARKGLKKWIRKSWPGGLKIRAWLPHPLVPKQLCYHSSLGPSAWKETVSLGPPNIIEPGDAKLLGPRKAPGFSSHPRCRKYLALEMTSFCIYGHPIGCADCRRPCDPDLFVAPPAGAPPVVVTAKTAEMGESRGKSSRNGFVRAHAERREKIPYNIWIGYLF